ncbi:MAG TPA: class I SAM-dependent methyltransferase [Flavisolibacter sp.]|nr:class I SAM-dependent methyltransferase [Flavisolibacter sp.]
MNVSPDPTQAFDLSAVYYDLFYQDKDYFAEAVFVDALIKRYNPASRDLLELGCGTGNYSRCFSDFGYLVTGLDLSVEMIRRAQAKRLRSFTGIVADITSFDLSSTFDSAVALFHVVSYLTETEKLLSCLQTVERHLRPGGVFIFDVWFTPAVCFLQPEDRVKEVADQTFTATRKAHSVVDDEKNTVTVNYHFDVAEKATGIIHTANEQHIMRHFSTPEISLMAHLTGFTLIEAKELRSGNPPSKNTWSVCYVLQKKV